MTQEEFDKTSFGANMDCIYHGERCGIASVNFTERLLGLSADGDDVDDDLTWVRCENVEMIK